MHLTRRYFLQSTGALSAYLGVAPMGLLDPTAMASTSLRQVSKGKTLVVIFLRGGADGLNLVIPHGDPSYAGLRRNTLIAPPSAGGGGNHTIDLDGYFGLHPRMQPLMDHFNSGVAVAAQAVGYDKNTRSHFEEQDVWETGIIGNTVNSDGWLNRHLATSEGHGPIRAVSIGNNLPRILRGDVPTYAVRGIEDLAVPDVKGVDPDAVIAALEHAYCTPRPGQADDARDLLNQSGAITLEGMKQMSGIINQPYEPSATYPNTDLSRKLMQVARLIKSDVGLEVAEVDYGGWDTHQNQGGANGAFANLAGALAGAMDAFVRDLGDRLDDVVVVTLTDFGRTARENGTNGTDHGWANCMFLLGGPVAKANKAAADRGEQRKVVADWPGLAPDQLHQQRDLLHTTDFRDVLAELVQVHLGNPNLKTVLPQHEFKSVGLIA
ncbi:MAG: DUF1501 domain-containing protein [Planctomycetota bacterium]|nr:DUF1501 domain-containing protein [Planctomycetota bacterium]